MESQEEAEAGKAPASPTLPSFKGRLITTDSDCDSDKDLWVGCDRCKKWRVVPKSMEAEVKAQPPESLWFCTMIRGRTCDDPQQQSEEEEEDGICS